MTTKTIHSQTSSTNNKTVCLSYPQRDSLVAKLIQRKGLLIKVEGLELALAKAEQINIEFEKQVLDFKLLVTNRDHVIELKQIIISKKDQLIDLSEVEIKGLKKYAKGRWWLGLLEGTVLGGIIVFTLTLII